MTAQQRLEMNKPDKIGKYKIDSVLGSGAMGVVYKGFDPFIKRPVAIKTIHPSLIETELSEELLTRFATEAEAVGRLAHPNIVSIFDYEEVAGIPYFVMEYVEGRELKDVLSEQKPLSLLDSVNILYKVLDGLAYVHHLGIVHRDIKPENIFVLNNGSVKIADFGIARFENSEFTKMGNVVGTPSYMSPEQCKGIVIDHRSDLFSLAVIFFEMITGRKPFKGMTAQETMHKVVYEACELPSDISIKLTKKLKGFFVKALAKCPEERFQNATEFKEELVRLSDVSAENYKLSKGKFFSISTIKKWIAMSSAMGLLLLLGVLVYQAITFKLSLDQNVQRPGSVDVKVNALSDLDHQNAPKNTLTPGEKAKVERLLQVAKTHLLVQRLVAPQGSNAYDAFHLVLEIDQNNADALSGLEIVEEKLLERITALQNEGKVAEYNFFVTLGEKLFPESNRWTGMK